VTASPGVRDDPGGSEEPAGRTAGEVLTAYLQDQATTFLRALAPRDGDPGQPEDAAEAGALLCRAARRIGATLHTYGGMTDPAWAEPLRAELGWLSATLSREHQYAARLTRLLSALHRLAAGEDPGDGATAYEDPFDPALRESVPAGGRPGRQAGGAPGDTPRADTAPPAAARAARGTRGAAEPVPAGNGPLAVGAARAGALLDRQLTLARTRAHSAALQALGSARFHALADAVAVLASEVPLTPAASAPAAHALPPLTAQAHARLVEAAAVLPLARAVQAYNADALRSALSADATADRQDAPWNRVRILLRLSRYAMEVFPYENESDDRLAPTGRLLLQHHEAAEAAAAVAAAARTPRIAPATAYALGVLHADQRGEVEAARFAFARLWH
jgi:hypothetical protein